MRDIEPAIVINLRIMIDEKRREIVLLERQIKSMEDEIRTYKENHHERTTD